jgi:hypothetical protein
MNVLYLDKLCFLCNEFVIYIYFMLNLSFIYFLMFAGLNIMVIEYG